MQSFNGFEQVADPADSQLVLDAVKFQTETTRGDIDPVAGQGVECRQ